MNVGRAITKAMQAQRGRDVQAMYRNAAGIERRALAAYWWWGWDINSRDPWGRGGIGKAGSDL